MACGPERPRGPVTNFLALSPRATGKRFGSAHFSLPFAARIAALARTCARAAHAPMSDDERHDVRSAGVADWKTAEQGNTERMLTAEVGPSSCDPYRHALTRRPPRKARPFFS